MCSVVVVLQCLSWPCSVCHGPAVCVVELQCVLWHCCVFCGTAVCVVALLWHPFFESHAQWLCCLSLQRIVWLPVRCVVRSALCGT